MTGLVLRISNAESAWVRLVPIDPSEVAEARALVVARERRPIAARDERVRYDIVPAGAAS